MIVATFLINLLTARLLWRFAEVKAHCNTGTCLKYPLDVYVDSVQDTEFAGHVFQNSVTLNPIQCYTWCVKDCRCLSFNYKENNEENYCELNEENHFTNKSNLKPSRGSRYYALRREHQQQGVTSCVGDVKCTNGCCKDNPCLNGGACQEICEPTSVRFNCSCPIHSVGKRCETRLRKSCQEYKAVGINMSGLYKIIDDSDETFQVFCDFDSEPGFAWNLIQSFSLSSQHFFQNDVVFYDNYSAVSGDAPNWQAYLIPRHDLVWLRDQSTHWRATCRYNTDGTVYTDYLRATFEDFDIIKVIPSQVSSCRKYELVNIRGNECTNCTAATWYLKGTYPLHIDSFLQSSCQFDGNQTADLVSLI